MARSGRLDRQALLVRASVGAATVLRNYHCRRCARHADHRRRSRLRPATAGSEPVLVLGRPVRQPRLLGLLQLVTMRCAGRLSFLRSATRVEVREPALAIRQKASKRAVGAGSNLDRLCHALWGGFP